MGVLTRGGTTSQQKFIKSGLSKKAYKKKQRSDYLRRTGKAKSGDRALTNVSPILPSLPEGENWTPEYNKATGEVRFVSGSKSTAWRTPSQWEETSSEQLKEIGLQKYLYKKKPKEYVKTYIGKSGLRKMPKVEKAVITKVGAKAGLLSAGVTARVKKEPDILAGVSPDAIKQIFPDVEMQTKYILGKAGEKNLFASPGLTKKMSQQMPDILEVYRKEARTFKDIRKEEGWISALTDLSKEISARTKRGVQATKSDPLGSIRDVIDPETWDLAIRRTITSFQEVLTGVHVYKSDKLGIMWTKTAKEKGLTSIMDDLNKEYLKLTPFGKATTIVAGLGSLKVATLPLGYFSTPYVKTKFTEIITDKDAKGFRTSFAKMTSKYMKPTFFKQKDIISGSFAKIKGGISKGLVDSVKKFSKISLKQKDILHRFEVRGQPITMGKHAGLKLVIQKGKGAVVKIGKATRDPFGKIKLNLKQINLKKATTFDYRAEEYFLPQKLTQQLTGKKDIFSFMRGTTEGLKKPFTQGDFGGVRQYLSSSLITKDIKISLKDVIPSKASPGAGLQVQVVDPTIAITRSFKGVTTGVQQVLKGLQATPINIMLGKVVLQESAVYGLMATPSYSKGKTELITLPQLERDIKLKDEIRGLTITDQPLKIKEITDPVSITSIKGKTGTKGGLGTIQTPTINLGEDLETTPATAVDLSQMLKTRQLLKTVLISKLTFGTPPPPPPPIIKIPPPIIITPDDGSVTEEDLTDFELFRGFKEFDISKILKGKDVFKDVKINALKDIKLPKIKI